MAFRDTSNRRINRPALQGYACLFGEPFFHEGDFKIFEPGCFGSMLFDAGTVGLWVDHDPSQVLATSGLEFETTLDGLAFRFPIDESRKSAATIRDCLDDDERVCVSVGCTIKASDVRKVGKYDVTYITNATLKEVSLVKLGAVPETFISLISLDDVDPNLAIEARSPRFRREKVSANITARLRRIRDALK
ncbi:HK97 family phage prohead protease [Aquabacter sp. CN5-332]|uniref:HK97 family phage prohead protease n=1 Tax=Aquabacter sp. CN5-332 TaxID=3156608 RepID=UPI0032B3B59C